MNRNFDDDGGQIAIAGFASEGRQAAQERADVPSKLRLSILRSAGTDRRLPLGLSVGGPGWSGRLTGGM